MVARRSIVAWLLLTFLAPVATLSAQEPKGQPEAVRRVLADFTPQFTTDPRFDGQRAAAGQADPRPSHTQKPGSSSPSAPSTQKSQLSTTSILILTIQSADPIPYIRVERGVDEVAEWVGERKKTQVKETHAARTVMVSGTTEEARQRSRARLAKENERSLASGLTIWVSLDAKTRTAFKLSPLGDGYELVPVPGKILVPFDAPSLATDIATQNTPEWKAEQERLRAQAMAEATRLAEARATERRQADDMAAARNQERERQESIKKQKTAAEEQAQARQETEKERLRRVQETQQSQAPSSPLSLLGEPCVIWAIVIVVVLVIAGVLRDGLSNACPQCHKWWARQVVGSTEAGRASSSRRQTSEAKTYTPAGQHVGTTRYEQRVPTERIAYLNSCKCKHCAHEWLDHSVVERDL
jgi:hypothetical protein